MKPLQKAYDPNGMNGEHKFWCKVWTIVATGLVCVVMSLSSCNMYGKYKIAEVIKGGADPIEARMALSGQDTSTSQIITSILTKNKK